MKTSVAKEKLHRFLLKKLKREIASGQSVLHISSKHEDIDSLISLNNTYTKIQSLKDLEKYGLGNKTKLFTYVIADMDMPELDDFEGFLNRVAPLIIRPGLLIIVASNLCTFANQVAICFGNALENYQRPSRAITPGYLRNTLLEKGFKVKNRFWQYDDKLLIMADIPNHF